MRISRSFIELLTFLGALERPKPLEFIEAAEIVFEASRSMPQHFGLQSSTSVGPQASGAQVSNSPIPADGWYFISWTVTRNDNGAVPRSLILLIRDPIDTALFHWRATVLKTNGAAQLALPYPLFLSTGFDLHVQHDDASLLGEDFNSTVNAVRLYEESVGIIT